MICVLNIWQFNLETVVKKRRAGIWWCSGARAHFTSRHSSFPCGRPRCSGACAIFITVAAEALRLYLKSNTHNMPLSPSFVMLQRKVVTLITESNTPSVVSNSLVVSQSAVVGFFHGKGDPLHCRISWLDSERKGCWSTAQSNPPARPPASSAHPLRPLSLNRRPFSRMWLPLLSLFE